MVYLYSGTPPKPPIQQSLGTHGHYLLLDDLSEMTEREKVCALAPPGEPGGASQRMPERHAQTFPVTQIAWLASVDRPGDECRRSSRYLRFELHPITATQKAVDLPSRFQLARMRRNLYRLAFKYFRQFWQAADTLKALPDTGLDGRMLDAIAVPCGIWATVGGVNPVELLHETAPLWRPIVDDQIIDDEFALLRAILQVKFKTVSWEIETKRPEWRTIGDALAQDYAFKISKRMGSNAPSTKSARTLRLFPLRPSDGTVSLEPNGHRCISVICSCVCPALRQHACGWPGWTMRASSPSPMSTIYRMQA